jgi:hypothetical protein
MTGFSQYFGSDIVWRSAGGEPALPGRLEPSGKSKVSNFDLHAVVEKDVAELNVSVDDSLAMEILQSIYELQ